MVLIACVISFAALGQIKGVREGTVAAAVLVGLMVRVLDKILNRFFDGIGLTVPGGTLQDKDKEKEETTEAQSA